MRQTDPRLANITSPSPERSSVPHRFRHALYAYPSMFRISEISQRGSPSPRGGLAGWATAPAPSARRGWCVTLTPFPTTQTVYLEVHRGPGHSGPGLCVVDELRRHGVLGSSALLWYSDVLCALEHRHTPQTCVGCVHCVAQLTLREVVGSLPALLLDRG